MTGEHQDEAACDVTPMVANPIQFAVERFDEHEDNEENVDEEPDSLIRLMLSQGFTLD